ncbi:hypothetical protein [Micromonospora sp. MH99]|uniref:hypothetical protein n=1 Tax=Micromonospora sp. MH99 TaxID=1945510 RepID=UPI001F39F487|nr:hypothetical protein [Micromonospora sp. MH99]MCF0095491.1 hypothetical protein [Micromonospora sp. MH99]
MANSTTDIGRSRVWAWPVALLLGLAIGIPALGSKGGVAFGVAMAVAFAVALGATRKRVDDERADEEPAENGSARQPAK